VYAYVLDYELRGILERATDGVRTTVPLVYCTVDGVGFTLQREVSANSTWDSRDPILCGARIDLALESAFVLWVLITVFLHHWEFLPTRAEGSEFHHQSQPTSLLCQQRGATRRRNVFGSCRYHQAGNPDGIPLVRRNTYPNIRNIGVRQTLRQQDYHTVL
jgi:hypothetical protein